MFLISVTHKGLHRHWELPHSAVTLKTMVVDVLVDGTQALAGPDMLGRLIVTEGIPVSGIELARAGTMVIDQAQGTLEIRHAFASTTPIYYHLSSSGEFFCASSLSLLQRAGVPLDVNDAALPELFVYRTVSPPRTLISNVYKCRFGERITVRIFGEAAHITERDPFTYPLSGSWGDCSEAEAAEVVLEHLRSSIRQFHPDRTTVAVPLSGGLDSSTIFRLAQQELGVSRSYSIGFPFEAEGMNREKEYAVTAARAFGSEHYYHESTLREYLFGFLHLLDAAEEPLHHLQSVLLGLLFQKGLEGEIYVISGMGGDILFGTETQFDCHRSSALLYRLLSAKPANSALQLLVENTGYGRSALRLSTLSEKLRQPSPLSDPSHVVWKDEAYGDPSWVASYFHVKETDIFAGRFETLKPYEDRPLLDLLSIASYLNDSGTPHVWGKAAEAAGRKLFAPLCEPSLVRFVSGLAWEDKLRKPKNILRRVAESLGVPRFIRERPKSGFGLNRADWALPGSIFEPLVSLAAEEFDLEVIRSLQEIRPKRAELFWTVLNYTLWKRIVIKREPLHDLEQELEEQLQLRAVEATGSDLFTKRA